MFVNLIILKFFENVLLVLIWRLDLLNELLVDQLPLLLSLVSAMAVRVEVTIDEN